MKKIILFSVILFMGAAAGAQSTPEAFLGMLPQVPDNICTDDTTEANRFTDRIYAVKAAIQEEVDRIHADAEAGQGKTKQKVLTHIAGQTGLSPAEMARLQNENISDEQAAGMINKSVGNQYGLSMDELSKLATMNEAEQEQWARNFAEKQMQKAEQNPGKMRNDQEKNARLFELAQEQKAIGERIHAKKAEEAKLLKNIDLKDTIETRAFREKCRPIEAELSKLPDGEGSTPAIEARRKALLKQIYNLEVEYCGKMSPLQLDYVRRCQINLKMLLPDYRKLTEVNNELARLQYGTAVIPSRLAELAAVGDYADILNDAYKYGVGKFDL